MKVIGQSSFADAVHRRELLILAARAPLYRPPHTDQRLLTRPNTRWASEAEASHRCVLDLWPMDAWLMGTIGRR
jgi:hypothetical protein